MTPANLSGVFSRSKGPAAKQRGPVAGPICLAHGDRAISGSRFTPLGNGSVTVVIVICVNSTLLQPGSGASVGRLRKGKRLQQVWTVRPACLRGKGSPPHRRAQLSATLAGLSADRKVNAAWEVSCGPYQVGSLPCREGEQGGVQAAKQQRRLTRSVDFDRVLAIWSAIGQHGSIKCTVVGK